MKKISVIVVDDHKLIREMWTDLFADSDEIEIVGESGGFDEAIEMIRIKNPDIVLLDINLPQGSGLHAIPLIRNCAPDTRIIVVSMHDQPIYAKKVLQMGAKAYVTKNSPHEEMFKAIEEVMNGRTYVCLEIAGQMLNGDSKGPDVKELSLPEIEITSQ